MLSPVAADDFEDIYLNSRASRNSSASSASDSLDEDYETDATSATSSIIDPHKLNGYAISSLKSQSAATISRRESMPEYVKRRDSLPDNYKHTSLPAETRGLTRHRSAGVLRQDAALGAAAVSTTAAPPGAAPAKSAISRSAADIVLNSNPDFAVSRQRSLRRVVSTSRLPSVRRSSSKLTRKQIEQQFDNDGDDIDDSCIWNVPLSPALYAQQKQQQGGALKKNHPLARLSKPSSIKPSHHKGLSAIKETEVEAAKRNPPSPVAKFSANPKFSGGIEALGEDAEALTRQFQAMPGFEDPQRRSSNPLPSAANASIRQPKRRSTTDPVVTARVVSRTRQSTLQPKSAEEERKHRQEYQRLVQQAAAADKKREEQKRQQLEARRKQEAKDAAEWRDRVLPHFDTACKEAKTRELWWRGIPPRFRSAVWRRRIGNRLQITPQVYAECAAKPCHCLEQIAADASGTLPELKIFDRECGPLHSDLVELLRAYAAFQPHIGYRTGMSAVAAMLLLNMSKHEAFVAMANLVDDAPLVRAVYVGDEQTSNNYYHSFLKVLNAKLPNLYKHLGDVRLSPAAYLDPMVRAMFCGQLPIDVATRVWDIMVFEGDGVLLRTALGVLTAMECRLYGDRAEMLAELESLRVGDDESAFILAVRQAFKATA